MVKYFNTALLVLLSHVLLNLSSDYLKLHDDFISCVNFLGTLERDLDAN